MQPYEIEISAVGRDGIDVIKEFINDSLRNDLRLDTLSLESARFLKASIFLIRSFCLY